MQGLEIAERYYWAHGAPMIERRFPEYKGRIAAGLVGDGSECYGFDDEISRDHDWGPGFCLWLNKSDYRSVGARFTEELQRLPAEFEGVGPRKVSEWGQGRVGVFEIGDFYKKFIGLDRVPATTREWRAIPESNLAAATNGKVFADPLGEFTSFRDSLKAFYPEDVRLKKIASRCVAIAQLGQYNYMRCLNRKEFVAVRYAEAQFCAQVISLVFLLNRQYTPFYKWMHRAVRGLPILGEATYNLLLDIATSVAFIRKGRLMEETCSHIIEELRREGLSDSPSDFLLDHAPVVQSRIREPELRNLSVWAE
ncbi:MAG: DUF4037 domain-containing protein [Chloroflexi bacterium]|nr:DUF4037 domain-containing protein [Chloroflexota bacterium]